MPGRRHRSGTTSDQIWILSEFGKPIFASAGNESELAATFALVQVLVRTFESWDDTLYSVTMDGLYIRFSFRSPLIMCIVSRESYNLSYQLDVIYNQVISILSKFTLKRIYAEKGDNFDLRRWLNGFDKRVDVCLRSFTDDPVVYLSGFRSLPLAVSDREFLVNTLATSINAVTKTVTFAVLVAHRQLIAMVRMRRLNLTSADFNILVNLVECHESLREAETWVPMCLPHFNQNSFLYAYISYLWETDGPCLIMLSISKDSFFDLASIKEKICTTIMESKQFPKLKASFAHPEPLFTTRQHLTSHLWHFMYKNLVSTQVCCCSPQKPFISRKEQLYLYKRYFKLTDFTRKSKNVKMFFLSSDQYTLLVWITGTFELHCTFNPLVSQKMAIEKAEELLRLLSREEKRVFFKLSPGLLNE